MKRVDFQIIEGVDHFWQEDGLRVDLIDAWLEQSVLDFCGGTFDNASSELLGTVCERSTAATS
eukprot:11378787-Prorocentrum_lima.AAC.1